MAFVHAISSAGVAHALTKACSAGELENCGCDRSLRGTSPEGFEVRYYDIRESVGTFICQQMYAS